jgi:hypothetical protein
MKIGYTFTLSCLLCLAQLTLKSQILKSYQKVIKPGYCSNNTADIKNLIGQQVKIWHAGGVYSSLNKVGNIKWPSEEMKKRGGRNGWETFNPQAGDTGTIVHILPNKGSVQNHIYILKIKNYYVPIGCYYVTDVDKPDSHEQSEQDWINDSILNVNYAAGCKFKIRNLNNNWSRAGSMKIDIQSEEFACGLTAKGIDTVMLCKYIFDNGSLPIEKAFILWLENGQGYVKSFFNNSKHQPTENKIIPFNSGELIDHFFSNRLDTVTSEPKAEISISHSLGYSIQLYTPGYFYRERLTDFLIRQNTTHPTAVWWHMISEKLAVLKEE